MSRTCILQSILPKYQKPDKNSPKLTLGSGFRGRSSSNSLSGEIENQMKFEAIKPRRRKSSTTILTGLIFEKLSTIIFSIYSKISFLCFSDRIYNSDDVFKIPNGKAEKFQIEGKHLAIKTQNTY